MKKTIKKIFLYGILPLTILICLFELIFIFPEPFFNYHKSYKQFEFYSTEDLPKNIDSILESVIIKIQGSEYYDPQEKHRVFYCPSGTAYHKIMFNINEGYVYNSTIRHNILIFANVNFEENRLFDKRFQMNYKIDNCISAGISRTFIKEKLPEWMMNGYQEYIRNYRKDYFDSLFLVNVKTFYNDSDSYWLINEQGISRPRYFHKARILIEFLIFVKGMKLEEIKSVNPTEDKVFNELTNWFADRQ